MVVELALLGVAIGVGVTVLHLRRAQRRAVERDYLFRHGIHGRARVLAASEVGESRSSTVEQRHLRRYEVNAEVHLPNHPPFVATIRDDVLLAELPSMQPGWTIGVAADPTNPQRLGLHLRERPTDPALHGIPIPPNQPAIAQGARAMGRVLQLTHCGRLYVAGGLTTAILLEVRVGERTHLAHIEQDIATHLLPHVQAGAIVHVLIDPNDSTRAAIAF